MGDHMRWVIALMLASSCLVSSPILAKSEPAKAVLWGTQCGKSDAGKPEPCVVQQFVTGEPGNMRLLLAQFGYDGPQNRPRLILSAPLGVLLPSGITLTIDDKKPVTVPFQICNSGGCLSIIDMDAATLDQFRKGKVLTVRYLADEKKPLDLPIKLEGLDAALKSIAP